MKVMAKDKRYEPSQFWGKTLVLTLTTIALFQNVHFAQAQLPNPVTIFQTLQSRFTTLLDDLGLGGPVDAATFNNPVLIPTTDSLPLASIEDAKYYMLFAGASYCYGSSRLFNWICDYCVATGPNVWLNSTIYNTTTQIAGLLNVNNVKQEIIVTFRGSYAPQNYVINNLDTPVPFAGVNENVKVHLGQLLQAESIYGQLKTKLTALCATYPNYRLTFVGHSLGSNLATLSLLKIRNEAAFSGKTFAHFSYGGPRVGNLDFVAWVNSMDFEHVRVVHYADTIPHIYPPTTVYTHFGTEFWIDDPTSNHTRVCAQNVTEDPTCSNSLSPVYSLTDHFIYYGVNYQHCLLEDPLNALIQSL